MADEPKEKTENRAPRGPRRDPLDELEERLEKLRFLFEQHFLGNEKRPPLKVRDQLQRDIRRFDPGANNAVDRFRHQNLTARFVTYDTYWGRILRAIEEGTYERDRFKADLHDKNRGKAPVAAAAPDAARDEKARAKAKDVADEAAAFLASLGAAPAVGMRGRSVAGNAPAASPAGRPSDPGALPPLGLRGQPVSAGAAPAPAPPIGLRGAPMAPPASARPTPAPVSAPPPAAAPVPAPLSVPPRGTPIGAPAPAAPPVPPMRGAPVAPAAAPPAAPAPPMRGAPVGGTPLPPAPMRGAPVGGTPLPPAPMRGTPVGPPKPPGGEAT
jgi:hypothetical protein